MSDPDTDLQAVNPVDTGDIPADSPPAVASEAPEPNAETSNGEETDASTEKDKPKGGFQRRISELTRAQRELREQLARERAEREALQARFTQPQTEDEPQRDKFDSWDEYERAHVRWVARQEIRNETQAIRQAEAERVRQAEAAQVHQGWESRLDAAREQYEDIDEYVDVVGERINPVIAEALKVSDMGPALVRHLGMNPKELDRITNLPGIQAVYELARLETKLAAKPKASAAPAPASPVKTTAAPQNALRDDMDTSSWIRRRNEELRSRR